VARLVALFEGQTEEKDSLLLAISGVAAAIQALALNVEDQAVKDGLK
jgi:hypothetical protein